MVGEARVIQKVVCLLNGVFDQPLQDLGGLTPLEKAQTPTLDGLVHQGRLTTRELSKWGGHETALFGLLTGTLGPRGLGCACFEAAALGYRLTPNQVAYSVRFVSTADGVVVDVDNQLLNDAEGGACCRLLNKELGALGFHWIHVEGPKALLISDSPSLREAEDFKQGWSPWSCIGNSWLDQLPVVDEELRSQFLDVQEKLQAQELNELRFDLEEDPVNGLLLYDGGAWPRVDAAVPNGQCLWTSSRQSAGVAKICGVPCHYFGKEFQRFDHVREGLKNIEEGKHGAPHLIWELPYLWQSTYKGDLLEKIKTIEWLDQNLLRPLWERLHGSGVELELTALRHSDIRKGAVAPGPVQVLTLS